MTNVPPAQFRESNEDLRLDQAEVLEQVKRIAASDLFRRSKWLIRFLEYSAKHTLRGDEVALKEFSVAVEVFERSPDYDSKVDAVVRVEARRLRQKLAEYYQGPGSEDSIVLRLPAGGYLLKIERREKVGNITQGQRGYNLRYIAAVIAVLLLAGSAGAAIVRILGRKTVGLPELQTRILTPVFGSYLYPTFAPDGASIYFSWDAGHKNFNIYRQSLNSGDPVRMTEETEHALSPSVSPDGSKFAYFRIGPDRCDLVLSGNGRSPRVLASVENWLQHWHPDAVQMRTGFGPVWSEDGKTLAVARRVPGSSKSAVFFVDSDSGAMTQKTFPPDHAADLFPAFSPDGRYLSFVREESRSVDDLYLLDLETGQMKQLTSDRREILGATWFRSDRIIFSSARDGLTSLWAIATSGGPAERFGSSVSEPILPSAHLRTGRVLYSSIERHISTWRTSTELPGGGERFLASARRDHSAQYSPDGKRIVFVSDRSGQYELWIADAADPAATARQLTHFRGAVVGTPRWSPDGSRIAFDARPERNAAIYVISASGGTARRLRMNSFDEKIPSWSRDGRDIYFSSNQNGHIRLLRMPANGGESQVVVDQPAYDSFETTDCLYFTDGKPGLWHSCPSGAQPVKVTAMDGISMSRYLFLNPRRGIFIVNETPDGPFLEEWKLNGHRRRLKALQGPLAYNTSSLSVSPDGRWSLWARVDRSFSVIAILEPVSRIRKN